MNTSQQLPVFVINLDRRPDRLEFMSKQLDAMNINWERISAVDAKDVSDEIIDAEVDRDRLMFRMARGSQACAITNFNIWRMLAKSEHVAALILQDDVELSPELVEFVRSTDWIPDNFDLIQFEKYGSPEPRRLVGKALECSPVPSRKIYPLFSRTAGAGAYVITRKGAIKALKIKKKARFPIDQILFNLNISNVSRDLKVALVSPYLAVQRKREFTSDIQIKGSLMTRKQKLTRGWYEINLIPKQLAYFVFGKAKIISTKYVK